MSFHTFRSKDAQWKQASGTPPVTPTAYNFGYIIE